MSYAYIHFKLVIKKVCKIPKSLCKLCNLCNDVYIYDLYTFKNLAFASFKFLDPFLFSVYSL